MSSPNHLTSDIEDTFSSNFLLGNTSFDSNSSGLVLIASPALLLFHDDPYMKVMQAYDTTDNESPISLPRAPIAPTNILPPSPVLPLSPKMAPKRTSTSAAPAMNQAAIRQLIDDRVVAALEAQAANMENADNKNRNHEPREAPIARKCSYKEFMSCQPFNFKDCKVKLATGTLTEEALSWWNSFAQPIRIEEAYKLSWGNDLKTYVRRFQELKTLCPTMVSDSEKMMEAFIRGLPRSIKGNVTASKPQTLVEAINISQRLMD
uniref:Reverse transcriptase domain-containing protein n=1 Tax=Tanacetum cinerariifolium TaxID=118510 RepID=A0A6L2NHK5_TANCI|nr:hypothetical protein [Tanacetum cinerariifolium]